MNAITRIHPHAVWTYGRYDNGGAHNMGGHGSWTAAPEPRIRQGPEQGRSDTEIERRKHGNISEHSLYILL